MKTTPAIESRAVARRAGRHILAILLLVSGPLAWACTGDEDPVVLDPVQAAPCYEYFDGQCTWLDCGSGGSGIIGCVTIPPELQPPQPDPLELPPPEGDGSGTDSDECGVNQFTARNGNAHRDVVDLRVAGAALPGDTLTWIRHYNTVPRPGPQYFGITTGWRHNWQYDLIEETPPGSARPNYVFITPWGLRRVYSPNATGGWSSTLPFVETLTQTPDGFDVQAPNGSTCRFFRRQNSRGHVGYRMELLIDGTGLQTKLVYNEGGLLARVVEPVGRSLEIVYKAIPYDTGCFDLLVGDLPKGIAAGEWVELPIPASLRGKPLRDFCLNAEGEQKLAVAEMQFFSEGSSVPLRGAGTGTGSNAAAAFDGDPTTGFVAEREADNLLHFRVDGPDGVEIDRVRILALPGREQTLQGSWLLAYRDLSIRRTVIASVVGSDGSRVDYDYDVKLYSWHYGPATKREELVSAKYPDGTQATYRYDIVAADRRALLVEANDPRYAGRAKQIRYTYNPRGRAGTLHQEINPETNSIYVSLEIDPNDSRKRTVAYSDLRQTLFVFSREASGRMIERKDGLGRVKRYEYANNGKGPLAMVIDHRGRQTEVTYDHRGRALGETRRGKSRLQTRDSAGRVLKSVDETGRETAYSRDSNGRITRVDYPDGTHRIWTYNEIGRITSVRNVDGGTHKFTYDARGLRLAWEDSKGRITRYGYDSRDRVSSVTDALGRQLRFERNDVGLITKVNRRDGTTESFTYDKYGRRTAHTDALGRTTRRSYDPLGRITAQIDWYGRVTKYDYADLPSGCGCANLSEEATRITHPDGTIESLLVDAAGRVIGRTAAFDTPDQATTTYTYDDDDNVAVVTDPLGRTMHYTYDDDHHRLTAKDGMGRVTRWTYDERGNVVSTVAPDGGVTKYVYDAGNRIAAVTDAAGSTTQFRYDALGNVIELTDALGRTTRHEYEGKLRTATVYSDGKRETFAYDAAGRVVKSVSVEKVETLTTYDVGNRVLSVERIIPSDPEGAAPQVQRQTFTYDERGRRVSAIDALGRTTKWTYDALGNVLTTTRPDGLSSHNTFDSHGRRTSATDEAGHVTQYEYNRAGDMTALIDAKGNAYQFTYNARHQKTAMIYPDGSRETWQYNLGGKLVAFTNRSRQIKTVSYNLDGSVRSEIWSNPNLNTTAHVILPALPNPVTYSYNAAGLLASLDNGTAKLTYSYDSLGRTISETSDLSAIVPGLAPQTVRYEYDAIGQKTELQYPNRTMVTYDYDVWGRLIAVRDRGEGHGNSELLAKYEYTSSGKVVRLARNNGVTTNYNYDEAGQLSTIEHVREKVAIASSRYSLDALGRRKAQVREDSIAETYDYDATSQLTAVDYGTGSSETFAYDPAGNRTATVRIERGNPPSSTIYSANALNQYTQISSGGVTFVLVYDVNGNLTDDGRQIYRYDSQNRLVEIGSTIMRVELFYDPRSRCVLRRYYGKGRNGQWVLRQAESHALTYDLGWNLIEERTLDGAQAGEYVHGARRDEVIVARFGGASSANLELSYPLSDGLGSTMGLADGKGEMAARYRYDAFGMPQETTHPSRYGQMARIYRLLFTGREWLEQVKLNDHRYRYFSPRIGRWITADPIGLDGGINLYSYASNNVVLKVDAFGLFDGECTRVDATICAPGWTGSGWTSGTTPPPQKRDCIAEATACGAAAVLTCSYVEKLPYVKCAGPLAYRLCMVAAAAVCAYAKESCDEWNAAHGF